MTSKTKGTKKQQRDAQIARLHDKLYAIETTINEDTFTANFTIMGETFTFPLFLGMADVLKLSELDGTSELEQYKQVRAFLTHVTDEETAARVEKLPDQSAITLIETWQNLIHEITGASLGES